MEALGEDVEGAELGNDMHVKRAGDFPPVIHNNTRLFTLRSVTMETEKIMFTKQHD